MRQMILSVCTLPFSLGSYKRMLHLKLPFVNVVKAAVNRIGAAE